MKKYLKHLKHKLVLGPILFLFIVGLLGLGLVVLWVATLELPDLSGFENRRVAQSTKIYDRTGEILLYDIHDDIRRTVVPFEEISPNIKNALVSIEDSGFYEHGGIQFTAILRAALKNLRDGDLLGGQGGSTITQQVLKNALLSSDKKLTRKIKEWVLAPRMESLFTKDEILNIYLNEIPFGGNIYGVQEASLRFFGKEANQVTVPEAAYLAALPKAPTYYSPYGNHLEELEARKNQVLKEMRSLGHITEKEHTQALETEVVFQKQEQFGIKAPHFVFYVRELLEEKFGEDVVENGGLKVITTLDWTLQEKAQEIVKKYALENEEKFNAENAAMVGLDPETGQILTMVGSRDYFDKDIDGNFNITTSKRQPGSTFKPFVYAEAFEQGYLPDTFLFDVQTEFSTACSQGGSCYSPSNYDDKFQGLMTMREALAQSRNIPAVKALYLTGINSVLELSRGLGINSLSNAKQYGLTLVLGGGEVSPLEMTSAYGVFANEGIYNKNTPLLSVEDQNGNSLIEYQQNSSYVLEKNITNMISDVLSDNVARTPAFGSNSLLNYPNRDVAVKTGTTNDYRDAWIIGYTPNFVLTTWAGNNDNRSMSKKVAGFIVTPMWREFFDIVLSEIPDQKFNQPIYPADSSGIKPVLIGQIENSSEAHSILHYVNKSNPRGPYPSNPSSDPQYALWEAGVSGADITLPGGGAIGNESSSFVITSPENGKVYDKDSTLRVHLNIDEEAIEGDVTLSVDGKTITTLKPSSRSYNLYPITNPLLQPGVHTLIISAKNTEGSLITDAKTFTIKN